MGPLCRHFVDWPAIGQSLLSADFVPKSELDPIPEFKVVENDANVAFYDIFGGSDDLGCIPF
jgi:hypothetical protein